MAAQTDADPANALPKNVDGWQIASSDRTFNNETLFDYIDGGAELFLSFGFTKVFNRIYSRENQPDIMVDVFYMNSSYDAFGVFSYSGGKIENNFGQQSHRSHGAILFWKDNFYISIISNTETEESRNAIAKIAKIIDKSIPEKGALPEILNYLPAEFLDKEIIRYFRHYIWLNSHLFISNENILNVDQQTECVLAQYGQEKNKCVLLIIKYPNREDASSAAEKFIKNYNPKLKSASTLQTDDKKWIGIESIDNFFVAVFDSEKEETVKKLISLAKEKIYNIK